MCDQLAGIRKAMAGYAAAFEPSRCTLADAMMVWRDATAIEHMATTVKALAAARIWRNDPRPAAQRLAAEQLAELAGTTLGSANDTITVGRRLEEQTAVAAAARAGELSAPQLEAITNAVAANPGAEGRLLDRAATASLAELRDESARVKAAAQPDPDRRRAEIRAARKYRSWTDLEGVGHIAASGNVEDIAQVNAAVRSLADGIFHAARLAGQREPSQAYEFDALVHLAMMTTSPPSAPAAPDGASTPSGTPGPAGGSGPLGDRGAGDLSGDDGSASADPPSLEDMTRPRAGGGTTGRAAGRRASPPTGQPSHPGVSPPAPRSPATGPGPGTGPGGRRTARRQRRGAQVKLLLRVDLDAFLRGYPLDGEWCELDGCGPVPMAAVRDLLEKGDPLVAAILTRGKTVFGVAHLRRRATAHQKTALDWLYPSCSVRGCNCRAHLEVDHRIDWTDIHYTALDLLDCLCRFHHARKTRDNWALVAGAGKRAFVPPDDPRHPRHHQTQGLVR